MQREHILTLFNRVKAKVTIHSLTTKHLMRGYLFIIKQTVDVIFSGGWGITDGTIDEYRPTVILMKKMAKTNKIYLQQITCYRNKT